MLMRHFYHCSRDANLADQPLNPFDGQTSEIRGLCFSDGEEQHFGPHSYQISLPDDCDFLTANLVWNMKLAVEEGTRAVGRNGEQLQLTLTMAEQACKEAMAEMGYDLDDETVEFVFCRAIEFDDCDESIGGDDNDCCDPWDEQIDGWGLQSVRALVAHKLGLVGAAIDDENGQCYISANPDLVLKKVEEEEVS
ncbi:hypothetical protein B9Y76_05760 [Stenotrophomonas maltophilia]|jgi:hypothetical protein|uniref:hypothetical protein n=1 Tax=Stenotrophomonas TaxID=40323 RepID=UPI00066AB35E|nr:MULTISPECIES: hypothetical protein [Stenotrophomonas]MBN5170936.1 hypothetical protein [Stenotrophomonas maltophilia]MCU1015567.1 hypothetical protein [Stenotrophomonas maltophilia]PJL01890.1 hypothetical protein B9Y76_05760 [Stenotrophomonas maltophilia]PZS77117.1 hypothetical protein A7X63_19115 [Stenotrophomonas maltophilia]QCB32790.1 hypothetical protein E5790_03455 [Stenotrophomonas sp. PAMC25021]